MSVTSVRRAISKGLVPGAELIDGIWHIPEDAEKPSGRRKKKVIKKKSNNHIEMTLNPILSSAVKTWTALLS